MQDQPKNEQKPKKPKAEKKKLPMEPLLLRPSEAAAILGISVRQLFRMAAKSNAARDAIERKSRPITLSEIEDARFPMAYVLPGMSDRRYKTDEIRKFVEELKT